MVSIRAFLLGFALAIALPIAAFFILLGWSLSQSDLKQAERRTGREAQAVATATRFILADMKSSMQLLASAPDLVDGSLEEFHSRARKALAGTGHFAIVVDASGRQLANTRVPYGSLLGKTANMAAFRRAVESNSVVVSDVFWGRTGGTWVFNVIIPLPKRDGGSARALILTKNAGDLGSTLPSKRSEGWHAALVDGSGKLITSTAPTRFSQGKPTSDLKDFPPLSDDDTAPENVRTFTANQQHLTASAMVEGTPWRAIVWGPVTAVQPSLLANWRTVLFFGGVLLAISLLAGLLVAEYLRRSVHQLAKMADVTGRGEVPTPGPSLVREMSDVSTALTMAAHQRNMAEEHFRVAAQEIAHRTKNLIAVVTAIVRQTARRAKSPEEMSSSLVARIGALGRSIDLLLSSGNQVDLRSLLENEIASLGIAESRITFRGPPVALRPEAVQALAMAFYELATNAVKYGALSNDTGNVTVQWEWRDENAKREFYVSWTERGGPPPAEVQQSGFGTRLMTTHLEAVVDGKATLTMAPAGLEWSLRTTAERVIAPQHAPQRPAPMTTDAGVPAAVLNPAASQSAGE